MLPEVTNVVFRFVVMYHLSLVIGQRLQNHYK
jgi:hypothetical protein